MACCLGVEDSTISSQEMSSEDVYQRADESTVPLLTKLLLFSVDYLGSSIPLITKRLFRARIWPALLKLCRDER